MPHVNHYTREITCKVVYYGPGLGGKTTNLQYIHQRWNPEARGNLVTLATEQDRTLFFDFVPLSVGKIRGFTTKFQLYTVPGQIVYERSRKLILKQVDGVVFVADSQPARMDANLESLESLHTNLAEFGTSVKQVPMIMQYNKRDLPGANSVEELRAALNPGGGEDFESIATVGDGVFPTLKCAVKQVLTNLKRGVAS